MQQGVAPLIEFHARIEQVGVVRAPRMEHQRRIAETRQHQHHIHAPPRGRRQHVDEGRVGHEVRHGDVDGLLRAFKRGHQCQVNGIAVAAIGLIGQDAHGCRPHGRGDVGTAPLDRLV
ncbi:hypothetical protein D3C71_1348900 [compost metagenome]